MEEAVWEMHGSVDLRSREISGRRIVLGSEECELGDNLVEIPTQRHKAPLSQAYSPLHSQTQR
jgi:hypothetical protein